MVASEVKWREKYTFKVRDGRTIFARVIEIYQNHVELDILSQTIFPKVYIFLRTEIIHMKDLKILQ